MIDAANDPPLLYRALPLPDIDRGFGLFILISLYRLSRPQPLHCLPLFH